MDRLATTLLRLRVLPILTMLAVGPALLLDLSELRANVSPVWDVLGVLALTFGLPYYSALALIASGRGLPAGPHSNWECAAAALAVAVLGAFAQWTLRRRTQRR